MSQGNTSQADEYDEEDYNEEDDDKDSNCSISNKFDGDDDEKIQTIKSKNKKI